jgi:hypothetical protein
MPTIVLSYPAHYAELRRNQSPSTGYPRQSWLLARVLALGQRAEVSTDDRRPGWSSREERQFDESIVICHHK